MKKKLIICVSMLVSGIILKLVCSPFTNGDHSLFVMQLSSFLSIIAIILTFSPIIYVLDVLSINNDQAQKNIIKIFLTQIKT